MPTALEVANAALARARAQVAEAQAADARAAAQVHDPRAAEVVLKDILDYIAMRLGNRGTCARSWRSTSTPSRWRRKRRNRNENTSLWCAV